jgi:hypothetical protein
MRGVASALLFALFLRAATAWAGSLSGIIENADKCKGVSALLREGFDPRTPKVFTGQYDAATGQFKIENLPEGTYDLRVYVEGGWMDGANLKLDPAERSDQPLTEDDRKEILDKIANYPDSFMEVTRALAIAGDGKRAKALVEQIQIRYRPFHSGQAGLPDGQAGDVIWRVEVWQYEKFPGGWVKKQRWFQVLSRVRAPTEEMPLEKFRNLYWLFDPALGGMAVGKDANVTDLKYKVPDPLTLDMGKTPGSIEKLAAENEQKKKQKQEGP